MTERGTLILLTGPRGSGKTQFLMRLRDSLQQAVPCLDLRGVLSPALRREGKKVSIDLLDLETSDRRELARTDRATSGPSTLHWHFHEQAIRWANAILNRAGGADLLIIDELGPLEFERGEGFSAGMSLLDGEEYRIAIVTVRPSLLEAARARWQPTAVIDLGESQEDNDRLESLRQHVLSTLEIHKE